MSFVADSSITLNWCFPEEQTVETISLLQIAKLQDILVPAIWPFEMANVLSLGLRKGRVDARKLSAIIYLLESLDVKVQHSPRPYDIVSLAQSSVESQLTAYDNAYLELA